MKWIIIGVANGVGLFWKKNSYAYYMCVPRVITIYIFWNIFYIYFLGAAGGPVRISCSGDNSKPPTIAEEAVDQLQENEKLVAGKNKYFINYLEINTLT